MVQRHQRIILHGEFSRLDKNAFELSFVHGGQPTVDQGVDLGVAVAVAITDAEAARRIARVDEDPQRMRRFA